MHNKQWVKIAAVTAAATMALTACGNGSKSSTKNTNGGLGAGTASGGSSTAGSGTATGSTAGGGAGGAGKTYAIGFEGPLSGDNQQLGINEANGAQLAVDQANAKGDLPFKVALKKSDDGGDPAKAPAAAQTLIQDTTVLGEVGPSFSGATKAVGKAYGEAKLAMLTPSASNGTLQTLGFSTFFRIIPNDNVEGLQGADWLARKGYKKVFVVDDLSDYGKGVIDAVQKELKAKGVKVTRQGVDAKTDDYGAISQTVKSSGAQALFYGGYDAQAAKFAKALKAAGFKGLTVTGNGGKSSVFTKGAADAGNGWYFTCGCADALTAAPAKAFTAAYKKAFNTDPSTYSPEAYDAANAMIAAIKTAAASGTPTRAGVVTALRAINYKGITTPITFQKNGELNGTPPVNIYIQKAGTIISQGLISKAK